MKSKIILLFFTIVASAFVTSAFNCNSDEKNSDNAINSLTTMSKKRGNTMKTLKIRIILIDSICHFSKSCMVEIRITNISSKSVLLNKRLAVGYRNSLSRELFVDIYSKKSEEVVSQPAKLYERNFSLPEDYVRVEPEESLSTTFNLFEWYDFPVSDGYELVVYYQADEELAHKPDDLLMGIYSSDRIEISILP